MLILFVIFHLTCGFFFFFLFIFNANERISSKDDRFFLLSFWYFYFWLTKKKKVIFIWNDKNKFFIRVVYSFVNIMLIWKLRFLNAIKKLVQAIIFCYFLLFVIFLILLVISFVRRGWCRNFSITHGKIVPWACVN